jgi:hypothetical protein
MTPSPGASRGMVSPSITPSTERILSQQPEEEIFDIEGNGVVQAVEIARKELESMVYLTASSARSPLSPPF